MGSKLPSHGSKDIFADVVKASFEDLKNVRTLLRRATRTSSVIGFAAGYFLSLVILY